MKERTFRIAGQSWIASRSTGQATIRLAGGGIVITEQLANIQLPKPECLFFGNALLRDTQNPGELQELFSFCHSPRWPASSPMAAIRRQMETPNHIAP